VTRKQALEAENRMLRADYLLCISISGEALTNRDKLAFASKNDTE